MAIKLKGRFSDAVKDVSWFNSEDCALALGRLCCEALDGDMLVSVSKTRKGDVCIAIVQGKGESEKFYFSDADSFLDWVAEVAGGGRKRRNV